MASRMDSSVGKRIPLLWLKTVSSRTTQAKEEELSHLLTISVQTSPSQAAYSRTILLREVGFLTHTGTAPPTTSTAVLKAILQIKEG